MSQLDDMMLGLKGPGLGENALGQGLGRGHHSNNHSYHGIGNESINKKLKEFRTKERLF